MIGIAYNTQRDTAVNIVSFNILVIIPRSLIDAFAHLYGLFSITNCFVANIPARIPAIFNHLRCNGTENCL